MVEVTDLTITIGQGASARTIVDRVSFIIGAGESLGLVGESGSGKSMTARSIIRLLPPGASVTGEVKVHGEDVNALGAAALRRLRQTRVGMIFQDPRAHINPVHTVGDFLTEGQRQRGVPERQARARAIALLAEVGIDDGERRLAQYPHQLSGGLLQRVMIASVLMADPDVLLADEPTTALDVTTQAEVMAILMRLRRERGVALLFITHDLELAAATCDRTAVMYAGRLVESQRSQRLFEQPRHPYTAGLLRARPTIDRRQRRLPVIPGRPVAAFEVSAGCAFAARCSHAQPGCAESSPEMSTANGVSVACFRAGELTGTLANELTAVAGDA